MRTIIAGIDLDRKPSTPLASIGARQMSRKTTPCGRCPSHGAHRLTEQVRSYVVYSSTQPIIKVYESIISSGIAGTEYGRLPSGWLALSVISGHTSNAASEGCHSIVQLIMSDLCTDFNHKFNG